MVFDNLIIRARSLSKSYGDETVLEDFNIDIWYGSIFGILGVSGSGKTTALRLLAGFENPDEGTIEMHNKVIYDKKLIFHQRREKLVWFFRITLFFLI